MTLALRDHPARIAVQVTVSIWATNPRNEARTDRCFCRTGGRGTELSWPGRLCRVHQDVTELPAQRPRPFVGVHATRSGCGGPASADQRLAHLTHDPQACLDASSCPSTSPTSGRTRWRQRNPGSTADSVMPNRFHHPAIGDASLQPRRQYRSAGTVSPLRHHLVTGYPSRSVRRLHPLSCLTFAQNSNRRRPRIGNPTRGVTGSFARLAATDLSIATLCCTVFGTPCTAWLAWAVRYPDWHGDRAIAPGYPRSRW